MNLSEQLDAARLTLANSDECQKHLFASGEALKAHHAELEAAVVRRLRITQADPTNTQNAVAAVISELHGDLARDLAVTGAAAAALAASEEYAAAHAAIAPRVGDVRRLEAELAAETHAANLVEAERVAKIDAARAEAIAKIEARFPRELAPA